MHRRPLIATLGAAALGAAFAAPRVLAHGAFPNRPVRFVVPFAPGGVVDLMARSIAPKMSELLGQPVLVENRPGGGATIGADAVAKSAPDGHTILLGTIVTHATAPFMHAALPYDALRGFAPVGFHGFNANWLLVNPSLPVKTFAEFVDYARRNPGKLNYGTPSIGSSSHLSAELLRQQLGLDYLHVPYKGSTPALQDLMGGQLHFMFDNIGSSTPLVKAGRLRALAVLSEKRSPSAPDLPTAAEQGLPGLDVAAWAGMFGPAGIPQPVLEKLWGALQAALDDPRTKEQFMQQGVEPLPLGLEPFRRYCEAEAARWAEVIKTAGLKID